MTFIKATSGEADQVRIEARDVVESVYKAPGAGGQHRNKTSSAVRLVHLPSGTIVTASDSRSQWVNRETAWERLRTTLATQAAEARAMQASSDRIAQFGGSRQWTWCAWRDEVSSPTGQSLSMKAAMRGGLRRLI